MALELIYTSSPKGLKAGTSGYCTVACTSGMPPTYIDLLESLSGYKALIDSAKPDDNRNPICFSHFRPRIAGKTLSILSRVSSYGFDYTGRTNKLAHHVVVEPAEQVQAGPASLLQKSGFMVNQWSGEPRLLPGPKAVPNVSAGNGPARNWEKLTGDAGWASVLAQSFSAPDSASAYLIFEPGIEVLPLIYEASILLRPELRWQLTFSTYLTTLPANTHCHWRFCLPDSPVLAEARRASNSLVIDLRRGTTLGEPKAAQEYLEAARTGKQITVSAPRKTAAARAPVAQDQDDFQIRILGEEEPAESSQHDNEVFAAPSLRTSQPRSRLGLPLIASIGIGIVTLILLIGFFMSLSNSAKKEDLLKDRGQDLASPKHTRIPDADSSRPRQTEKSDVDASKKGSDSNPPVVKKELAAKEHEKKIPEKEKEPNPRTDKNEDSKPESKKLSEVVKKEENPTPTAQKPSDFPSKVVVEFRLTDLPDRLVDTTWALERLSYPALTADTGTSLNIKWKDDKKPNSLREIKSEGSAQRFLGTTRYGNQGEFFVAEFVSRSDSSSLLFRKGMAFSDEDWAEFKKHVNYVSILGSQSKQENYRCYFKVLEIEPKEPIEVRVIDDLPVPPRIPLKLDPAVDRPHSLPQFAEGANIDLDVAGAKGAIVTNKDVCTERAVEISWPVDKENQLRILHRFRQVMEAQPKGLLELTGKKQEEPKKKDELKMWWEQVPKDCFPYVGEKPDKWHKDFDALWNQVDAAEKKRQAVQNAPANDRRQAEDNKAAAEKKFESLFEDIRGKCTRKIEAIQAELVPKNRKVTLRVKLAPGQDAIIIKLGMTCTAKEK